MSDEERSFLEAQVRRHRVARSLSDRCRMILRCADGLPTAGAVRLGAAWTVHPGHDAAAPSDLTLLTGWRHTF